MKQILVKIEKTNEIGGAIGYTVEMGGEVLDIVGGLTAAVINLADEMNGTPESVMIQILKIIEWNKGAIGHEQ